MARASEQTNNSIYYEDRNEGWMDVGVHFPSSPYPGQLDVYNFVRRPKVDVAAR